MRHPWALSIGLVGVGVAVWSVAGCVGDSTTPDTDATADSPGTKDSPSGDSGPTGCDARTADDNAGIFVATTGGDVNGCGTRANPCKTIAFSLAAAKATTTKTTLYLASGTYAESVTLDTPVTIEGGWKDTGGTWTPVCDATISTAVVIQGTTNETVHAAYTGSATLRYLKVASKTPADPGESLYGVFASGSATNLTLDTIAVDVAGGGAGAGGDPGSIGTSAADAGCTPSTGSGGPAGPNGGGATAGSLSPTGYLPTNGGDAGVGSTGSNGTAGGAGQCMNSCESFGGSCLSSCTIVVGQACASTGLSGCAGTGGTGGSAGNGGGASVAVFVWDAHLTVFGGVFTSGNGGNGGSGGVGGDGGAGAPGAAGAGGSCNDLNSPSCALNKCTGVFVSGTPLTGGAAGGNGGAGGTGGQGGGGSGGVSYAIVQGGDAGIVLNANPKLAHGDGGTGGAASGANGTSADRFP